MTRSRLRSRFCRTFRSTFFLLAGTILTAAGAVADLEPLSDFNGRGGWSIDGGGPVLGIDLEIPEGSTVVTAILYCGTGLGPPAAPGVTPTVILGDQTYGANEFVPLPWAGPQGSTRGMQAFRADIGEQVRALIGAGSGGSIHLDVASATYPPPGRTTGQVVVVVFENQSLERVHIALLDGAAPFLGTAFVAALPGRAEQDLPTTQLSVGIGFSTGSGDQKTILNINGRRLTSIAGGDDDHFSLMTVGGLGDDPGNPPDPYFSPVVAGELDDELYDLSRGNEVNEAPFVLTSETALEVTAEGASEGDLLFFAGLKASLGAEPTLVEIPALGLGGLIVMFSGLAAASVRALRLNGRARR